MSKLCAQDVVLELAFHIQPIMFEQLLSKYMLGVPEVGRMDDVSVPRSYMTYDDLDSDSDTDSNSDARSNVATSRIIPSKDAERTKNALSTSRISDAGCSTLQRDAPKPRPNPSERMNACPSEYGSDSTSLIRPKDNQRSVARHSDVYIPEDSLFWCIFKHVYGDNEPVTRYKNREIEEKGKIIEYLRSHPSVLKPMKITKVATQEIMGDLMTNKQTTLFTMHAIVAFYKLHVLIVFKYKHTYIEYVCDSQDDNNNDDDDNHIVVIESDSPNRYRASSYTNSYVKANFMKQDKHEKVLKGISSYKVSDLEDIAKRVGFEHTKEGKSLKKVELYEALSVWFERRHTARI
jgi:hypothetical protein